MKVRVNGGFIGSNTKYEHNANWNLIRDEDGKGASCVVSHGQPADTAPHCNCYNTHDSGYCDLYINAGLHGTDKVKNSFIGFVNETDSEIASCRTNPHSDFPNKLNFTFCGDFVNDGIRYPICFAQGFQNGYNNWHVSSPDIKMKCVDDDTSNVFNIASHTEKDPPKSHSCTMGQAGYYNKAYLTFEDKGSDVPKSWTLNYDFCGAIGFEGELVPRCTYVKAGPCKRTDDNNFDCIGTDVDSLPCNDGDCPSGYPDDFADGSRDAFKWNNESNYENLRNSLGHDKFYKWEKYARDVVDRECRFLSNGSANPLSSKEISS